MSSSFVYFNMYLHPYTVSNKSGYKVPVLTSSPGRIDVHDPLHSLVYLQNGVPFFLSRLHDSFLFSQLTQNFI